MSRTREIRKILRPIAKKIVDLGLGHFGVKGKEIKTEAGVVIPTIRTVGDARKAAQLYS